MRAGDGQNVAPWRRDRVSVPLGGLTVGDHLLELIKAEIAGRRIAFIRLPLSDGGAVLSDQAKRGLGAGDGAGVVGGILQRRRLRLGAVADHRRDALFGLRRKTRGEKQGRAGDQ